MIYLDIVTIYTPAERIIRRGGMMIREQYQEAKRYLRLKDDRRPGEEMLLPLEKMDDLASDMYGAAEDQSNQVPQLGSQLLLEPF
ncbi:MAG: hypothetical protein Q7S64_01325 [bacterium]|nr:hypothetical protein [bacterium]